MGSNPMQSIQEAAAKFANSMLANINASAAETVGVDVMYFRLKPDKRNQDIIFQTYTLYGVEDCPLKFKAVYSDTGYDDAAITYNIMGLEYSVPLTLDIAVNTWYKITNYDGTLPQRGDIVFIPISNKLVEVVSMTPVKAVGAQVTSYKINCSIYKPNRSRVVGENLKTSIEENTVNLDSIFGKAIDETLKDIVDDKNLSMFDSSHKDKYKEVSKSDQEDKIEVINIISHDLEIDGHIISRAYYDGAVNTTNGKIVTYKTKDELSENTRRCLSCWFNITEAQPSRNIKSITVEYSNNEYHLVLDAVKKFNLNDDIVIERGNICIPGKVINLSPYTIKVDSFMLKDISSMMPNWAQLPGYIIRKDNVYNILSANGSNTMSISIKAERFISLNIDNKETLYKLSANIKPLKWYAIIINIGSNITIDVFSAENGLHKVSSVSKNNTLQKEMCFDSYFIKNSPLKITNIRLYDVENTELNKQLIDLVTFNIPNDSHAIINDSPVSFLDKKYVGVQR